VRACEQVVSAALDTITAVLQQVRTQGVDCSRGDCGLSQAWEVGEHHLSRLQPSSLPCLAFFSRGPLRDVVSRTRIAAASQLSSLAGQEPGAGVCVGDVAGSEQGGGCGGRAPEPAWHRGRRASLPRRRGLHAHPSRSAVDAQALLSGGISHPAPRTPHLAPRTSHASHARAGARAGAQACSRRACRFKNCCCGGGRLTLRGIAMQGPRERACFYLPGVVSAMARVLLKDGSKGTRSRLASAALRCLSGFGLPSFWPWLSAQPLGACCLLPSVRALHRRPWPLGRLRSAACWPDGLLPLASALLLPPLPPTRTVALPPRCRQVGAGLDGWRRLALGLLARDAQLLGLDVAALPGRHVRRFAASRSPGRPPAARKRRSRARRPALAAACWRAARC
jgi:hypothetical protein